MNFLFPNLFGWQDRSKNLKKVSAAELGLREVKDNYKDVDDYLATFEPLLFEEVKAQIVQKKDTEEGFIFYFYFLPFRNFCFWFMTELWNKTKHV